MRESHYQHIEPKKRHSQEIAPQGVLVRAVVVLVLILGITGSIILLSDTSKIENPEAIKASDLHICLNQHSRESLSEVKSGNKVFLRLTLTGVPVHRRIPMHAKWFDPDGKIFHENNWHTHLSKSHRCYTHCKITIPRGASLGLWKVEVSAAGKDLGTREFNLID